MNFIDFNSIAQSFVVVKEKVSFIRAFPLEIEINIHYKYKKLFISTIYEKKITDNTAYRLIGSNIS